VTTRRAVLIAAASAAGALLIGYSLWPSKWRRRADSLLSRPGERFVANWLKIADDDTITLIVPHCDMGTGIFTALAQMAAEELDAEWRTMHAETAPADWLFANGALAEGFVLDGRHMTRNSVPAFLQGAVAGAFGVIAAHINLQTTGGSSAVRMTGVYGMRVAAAAAREMLIRAAAARLHAPAAEFDTAASRVVHVPSGRSLRFGELAAAAAQYEPSSHPKLKSKSRYRLVGRSVPRFDVPDKVSGATRYGIDVDLPEIRYGAIKIAPVFGGKLVSVDEATVLHRRGIERIVRLDDAVVVIADRFWRARDAADALTPVFDGGANGVVSSQALRERHREALKNGPIKRDMTIGRGSDALQGIATVIERFYNVPYLAHAPLEPVNGTALFQKSGELSVWAGTQDALGARAFCAKLAGLDPHNVTFHQQPSGGAFGRRLPGHWNFLKYVVKTAMAAPGVPIKLIFTREQDLQHDYYRPNVTSRMRAALGKDGMPLVWVNDYTSDDAANAEAHVLYAIPNQAYGSVKVATHVPTGPWRSVEASWHGFFIESFIDELAYAARQDPLQYRLRLLKDKPRHAATLALAAEKAGWNNPLPAARGRGIAMVECFGTIATHIAEIEVSNSGELKVQRITSAADCGMAINPDGFKAQIEGGIVFGLSAALHGAITLDHGAVTQRNFPQYDMVRLGDCPDIEVHIHESDAPLGGAGEPGTPPVAPCITNAIFATTGVRIRELPVLGQPLRLPTPKPHDS